MSFSKFIDLSEEMGNDPSNPLEQRIYGAAKENDASTLKVGAYNAQNLDVSRGLP